jgi:glycosyltransferase involved in cell wall biosynthesis
MTVSKSLHLAIDASNIRQGGGVTYLVQMLSAADPCEFGINFVTVWTSKKTAALLPSRPWLKKLSPTWTEAGLLTRTLGQQFLLGIEISRHRCDALFSPGGTVPFYNKVPVITMSQNMLPFESEEAMLFGRCSWMRLKMLLLFNSQLRSFKVANGIIFLTNYAREGISRYLGEIRGMHTLVPHGIEPRFDSNPKYQRSVSEYTIQNPYTFLYVSIVMPYKHQIEVAKAASKLRLAGKPIRVHFVGNEWGNYGKNFRKILVKLDPNEEYLIWSDKVLFSEIHKTYLSADAFLFASSCENLPNILLEAMASGLPIASSNKGPMPEVLGSAGVYFDPSNTSEIADAMEKLINGTELRTSLAEKAKESSRKYSWHRCAEDTFSFIFAVVKRSNGKLGKNV